MAKIAHVDPCVGPTYRSLARTLSSASMERENPTRLSHDLCTGSTRIPLLAWGSRSCHTAVPRRFDKHSGGTRRFEREQIGPGGVAI